MPTESFFSQSSLAYIASAGAGKDGKAYSIRPTDGTGDFTFSRGSNLAATRVGADGLIEKGRENVLLQSNQFDTTWVKSNTTITGGQADKDGGTNAWKLNETSTPSEHQLRQNFQQSGVYCLSIYAKAAERDVILFRMNLSGSWTNVFFNLTSGSVVSTGGFVTATITSVGNGWYRCEAVFNNITGSTIQYQLGLNNTTYSYAGEVGKGILVQDAQLEVGLAATEYIESGATTGTAGILENTPRFDYSNGASCPSLLLEPSRTNLISQSEYFGSYINYGSADTANSAISVQGVNNATLIAGNGTQNQVYTASPDISVTSAGLYTLSIFAKKGTNNYFRLYLDGFAGSSNNGAYFDLLNGSTPTSGASIKDYGNGWYKCSITATIVSGDLVGKLAFNVTPNTNSVFFSSASEANGKNIYIYGATLEAGSYPTSYIPTYGTSQTRAADVCGGAGDANTFNSTEGVLYAEIAAFEGSDNTFAISLSDGSSNNRIFLSLRTPQSIYRAYSTGGGDINFTGLDVTSLSKVAVRYSLNNFSLWINGVKRSETLSYAGIPANTLNNLSFDRNGAGELDFYGNVKQVLTFNTALSDADLATLTTI